MRALRSPRSHSVWRAGHLILRRSTMSDICTRGRLQGAIKTLARFVAVLSLALPVAAHAVGQRTFVAPQPVGDDAHVSTFCALDTPCRTFGAAMSVTSAG